MAVTILDPGPDGVLRTADDGPSLQGFNLNAAALALPVLNELQNTPGHDDFYTLEVSASEAPYGLRITPSLRNQSGQPYARTFSAGSANGINYGSARAVSGFVDGYNLFNTNAATNINWSSGATYLTPSTIVPPRIARVGVKFDW